MIKKAPLITSIICLFISKMFWAQTINFTSEEALWIKNHPKIEFGYEPHWEPYEIYENGIYTGIANDYLTEIEKATGIEINPLLNMTWSTSIEGLKNGTVKLVPSCGITDGRKEFLHFTTPYISDPIVIATRESYEFVESLDALTGKTIALPKNYYTFEIVSRDYPGIKILELDNIQTCLEFLRDGKVDAFVGSLGVISYYMNKKGFIEAIKIAAPTDYPDNEIALAVTKDWKIFRDICQKVFDTISVKRKSEIRKEWISVRYEHGFPWKTVLYWTGIIAAIVLVLFLLFFSWNRSLVKQINARKKNETLLKDALIEIKKQDQEKKVLLQEIHHRVKNNLQIITSLIRLQANTNKSEAAVLSLNQSIDRIRAVALIHEKTYNSKSLDSISTKEYIRSLADDIIASLRISKNIDIQISTHDVQINSTTMVPLALILNELIANSIRHGLKNQDAGKITIDLNFTAGHNEMTYTDNGQWIENKDKNQFGTSVIDIFTEQLDGSYTLDKTPSGTCYKFVFSEEFA